MIVHTFTPLSGITPVCISIASFAFLFSSPVLISQACQSLPFNYNPKHCVLWFT